MGANEHNTQLKEALEAQSSLKERGFTSSCGPTGAVVVDRWNHVRGVWHFHLHSFFWTPAGYGEPTYRCSTLQEAIAYSLETISKI
jgi:hypothetical protein